MNTEELSIFFLLQQAATGKRLLVLTPEQCRQLLTEIEDREEDAYQDGKSQGQLNAY